MNFGFSGSNRTAVAVTEEPWRIVLIGDADAIEERRQQRLRLDVHEIDAPALAGGTRRRSSVARAREYEAAITAGAAKLSRIVLPHRERAQSLVQEHEERRIVSLTR